VTHPDGLRDDGQRTQLEDFLAIVAHEVSNPLGVASTAATMLANLENDAEHHPGNRSDLVAMIKRNIDLAILLMDRMSLARDVENDTINLTRKRLDLVRLLREAVSDLAYTSLSDHPIDLVTVDELSVDADSTAVREIIFNLLANAAKYSALDAEISISLERHDRDARLVIRDHGLGVTPSDSDRIFDKFFQTDAQSKGVGLGLFVSRGLARAHGGDITVRAATGSGAEFVLDLPAVASPAPASGSRLH
jgi:signal transduction histidine kinase